MLKNASDRLLALSILTGDKELEREAIAILQLLDKTTGWTGYGWHNNEYIDDIQAFFNGETL